jgi:putative ATP-dependent endonuclease of OLD family
MLRVRHVEIENYRSIKELSFDPLGLCALVGPNNAGKSNILSALDLLLGSRYPTEASLTEEDYYRRDTRNKPRISATFDYQDEGGYPCELRIEFGPEASGGELKHRYWGEGESARYVYKALRQRFSLIRLDVNRSVRQHQPTNRWTLLGRLLLEINAELRRDAARMAEFEESMRHLREEVLGSVPGFQTLVEVVREESARQLQRSVDEVSVEFSLHDPWNFYRTLQLVVREAGMTFRAEQMGMGLQSSLTIALLRAYAKIACLDRAVIAIEEPELFLHPLAERQFYALMRELAYPDAGTPLQIIYTTHSDQMIDLEHFEEICVVRKEVVGGEWATTVTMATFDALIAQLEAAGVPSVTRESIQARLASTFDRSRADGVFASVVILVEGQAEQLSLAIYAQAAGFDLDAQNVAVVNAGGKTGMPTLYRIFTALRIPTYVIFDADRTTRDKAEINDHIFAMLGAELERFPDTMIAETFTVWEEDYEVALRADVADYEDLEAAARERYGGAGKGVIARHCATELAARREIPALLETMLHHVRALIPETPPFTVETVLGTEPGENEPPPDTSEYGEIPF